MLRSALKLLTGGVLAYGLNAGFGLVIAALAGPATYGHYLTCIAIASFLGELCHARFDLAFAYARSLAATYTIWLAATVIGVSVVVVAALTGLIIVQLTTALPWALSGSELWILLVVAFLYGQQILSIGLAAARGDFSGPAIARVLMAGTAGVLGCLSLLLRWGVSGLLAAQAIAYGFGIAVNGRWFIAAYREMRVAAHLEPMRNVLAEYRRIPLEVLPGSLLFMLTWQVHLLLAPHWFSPAEVGVFGLAFKLTTLATTLVTVGFAEPIRLEMLAGMQRQGGVKQILLQRSLTMTLISVTVYGLLFLALTFDFSRWVAREWQGVQEVCRYLIISGIGWTIIIPLSGITHVGANKKPWLYWHIGFLASVLIPWGGHLCVGGGLLRIAAMYALTAWIFGGVSWLYFLRIAHRHDERAFPALSA